MEGAYFMQSNKVYAYCRVSSIGQSLDRQIEAVKKYSIENGLDLKERDIICDKISGKNFNRDGYRLLADHLLRVNDTLIVKELDRLGRDYEGIKDEWQRLCKDGINIIIIDTPLLNTANKTDLEKSLIANIVFELLAYTSAKERDKIRQRQAEGIAVARTKGKKFGRPKVSLPEGFNNIIEKWKKGDITAKQAMSVLGLKRTTFYKFINQYQI